MKAESTHHVHYISITAVSFSEQIIVDHRFIPNKSQATFTPFIQTDYSILLPFNGTKVALKMATDSKLLQTIFPQTSLSVAWLKHKWVHVLSVPHIMFFSYFSSGFLVWPAFQQPAHSIVHVELHQARYVDRLYTYNPSLQVGKYLHKQPQKQDYEQCFQVTSVVMSVMPATFYF